MIQAMQQRGFSPRTHQSYLIAVTELAKYFHRSPDQLDDRCLQDYFNHLVQDRGLARSSCNVHLQGIRFFYLNVLHRPDFNIQVVLPKQKQRIPDLLTRAEVSRICHATINPKHYTFLVTAYGTGLRLNELVHLRVRDIDSERHLLRVEQGKGGKDRLVILSEGVLHQLRSYRQLYRPHEWLFYSTSVDKRMARGTGGRLYNTAKHRAKITKRGGIHSLRHAYATHQLEAGMRVDQLQRQHACRSTATPARP